MRSKLRTYAAYSIACAFVWLLILVLVEAIDPPRTRKIFLLVALGWWIGWLSATIARRVYPPPRQRSSVS